MKAIAVEAGDDAFGWLIAPLSTAAFFERYFESEILHVERSDAEYFAAIYSVGCIEDALLLGANDPDHFALIKHDGAALTRENMMSERTAIRPRSGRNCSRSSIDARSMLAAFAAGYTLNIKDAGAYHPRLAQLCNRLQSQLGFYTQANVYFTPPRARGFAVHYDTHDTLIVQVEGDKNWQIYNPVVALPLEGQPFSKDVCEDKLGPPRAISLAAGDSLYIPHGFAHTAETTAHRSLHLTFAISPIRVVDLLASLVQLAARDDVELRRALPPGWHRDPEFAARLSARLVELMRAAIAPDRVPLAAELVDNDVFSATRTIPAGMFDTLAAFERLRPSSRIWLRDDTPFQLRERGDRLDIVLASKVVTIPVAGLAGFTRLDAGPATFAEIEAILPTASGPSFVRTLAVEGLILIDR